MKAALRPVRMAFEVDILSTKQVQVDDHGKVVLDERGDTRFYAVHLLTLSSTVLFVRSAATVAGMVLGGQLLAMTGNQLLPLLLFDLVTNLLFMIAVVFGCHPDLGPAQVRLRDLVGTGLGFWYPNPSRSPWLPALSGHARSAIYGVREVLTFLRHPAQRPLCWLLLGGWVLEVVTEFYDGGMIVRHVLGGTPDAVRYAQLAWECTELLALACLPVLTRRVDRIAQLFLVAMALDGAALMLAGHLSAGASSTVLVAVSVAFALDRGLVVSSNALLGLAISSASSPGLRGRLVGGFAVVVLVSDLIAEVAATLAAESAGIPGMVLRIGAVQVCALVVITLLGGRTLWNYGLRSRTGEALPGHRVAT